MIKAFKPIIAKQGIYVELKQKNESRLWLTSLKQQ